MRSDVMCFLPRTEGYGLVRPLSGRCPSPANPFAVERFHSSDRQQDSPRDRPDESKREGAIGIVQFT